MQRSGLALAVLALLYEAPMHPYRMQQLIKERGKHQVINVGQRSQLYKTIDRLLREGLIKEVTVERDTTRPERTVYGITDDGTAAAMSWTKAMLSTPRWDFPEFPAGLAYLPLITPAEAIEALETRLHTVRAELAAAEQDDATAAEMQLPRLLLIENEYLRQHLRTDIEWLESVIADLRDKKLDWSLEQMAELAAQFNQ